MTYTRGYVEMYTLSRAYIPGEPSVHAVAPAKMDMTEGLSVSPRRLKELRAATASDCALQKRMQVTMKGWPTSDSHLDVRAYYNVRHELTMQNGLVFKDCRIVVTTSLRKNIIATVNHSYIRVYRDVYVSPRMPCTEH